MTVAHSAIARDLFALARELAPEAAWVERTWQITATEGDRELSVRVAGGWQPQFVQIAGTVLPSPPGTTIPFFRELSRHGMVRAYGPGERHRHHPLRGSAEDWTRDAIRDGLRWLRTGR